MAQIRRQITTLIRRYVAALEGRGIPVERVILFGSHASGHPDESSDIDIAVISPQFDALSLLERYEQLGLANRDLHAPLDIVGFSPSQIAQCEPESFLAEILRTGVEVPVRPRKPAPRQFEEGTNHAPPQYCTDAEALQGYRCAVETSSRLCRS
jgi:predicted nucleotidyltransferase